MAFAAVAAVAVIGAGVAAFVTLGGSPGSASEAEDTGSPATTALAQPEEHPEDHSTQDQPSIEPDPTVPTTEHAPLPDLCGSESGMCAFITDIRLDGDRYIVDYATAGFDPLIHGEDPGASEHDHHVHFFFDTTDVGNAGTNGQPPGSWEVWVLRRAAAVSSCSTSSRSTTLATPSSCASPLQRLATRSWPTPSSPETASPSRGDDLTTAGRHDGSRAR